MASVKFDSTEILTSAYLTQFMKHETVTDRILTTLPLARQDGSVLIADRRGMKVILLQGYLNASTSDNLDAAIDSFNELFSRPEKNLDIAWNGGTRRYVATCTKHAYDRDHYNISAVPWTAEFTVISGEGMDTSTTTALNAHSIVTSSPVADSFTISGSKPAKPYIILKGSAWSANTRGVEYKNTDTGEKIVLTKASIGTTDYFIIDCLNRKCYWSPDNVTLTEILFYGVFPTFKIGTNNVLVTMASIANQSTLNAVAGGTTGTAYGILDTVTRYAQSFSVPYTDATFHSCTLEIAKVGTPGNVSVRLETDNNGSPSGTLVDAGATITLATASIGTSPAAIRFTFTSFFTLVANTKYWIVVRGSATLDGSNQYLLYPGSNYSKGEMKFSSDSGATYGSYQPIPASFAFSMNYGGDGGTSGTLHTVRYTKTYL